MSPALPRLPGRRLLSRALSALVDPFVVASFDRTGFAIHSLGFEAGDLDVDLRGRRCLVTGANSGIGFETALALAARGAEVVLLCRSLERGERALARILERVPTAALSLERLDVSDLADVERVVRRLGGQPVDVLVHNAGVLPHERIESPQGMELCFATHVAGPFALTRGLRPALERSPDARVVWVSSGGMYARRLALFDPHWTRRRYDGVVAYAETKRAQVVLSELFAREFAGTRIKSNAMHPGWAETPSVKRSLPGFHRLTRRVLRTPAQGADTVVWLAACERLREESGGFFFDRQRRRTHFVPFTRETRSDREALWKVCELCTASAGSQDRARARGAQSGDGSASGSSRSPANSRLRTAS